MSHINFDVVIDRKNTNSIKYDFAQERGLPADVLPLWVADMDFQTPECVQSALHQSVSHGIFGYSEVKSDYTEAVTAWFSQNFNWDIEPNWIVKTPGVVFAIAMAIRAITQPGEAVLIQPPVYYPFYSVITDNNRTIVTNELLYENGTYHIDFDDFEQKIIQNNVKLFLLCSPHNPVGRVWTKDELVRIGEICKKYNVAVVSDEIHCDFAFTTHSHTPFSVACPHMMDKTIVCTAPSKTFNIAGLQVSNIILPNESLRARFRHEISATGYSQLNTLGLVACKEAYVHGSEWLHACKAYLQENLDFLRTYLQKNIPQITLVEPEGTYFAWLDCSGLNLNKKDLNDLIVYKAKLWLDAGHIFGKNSWQFQRVVLACPQATLKQALHQLKAAIKDS